LDITPARVTTVEALPPLHADPFDRLLAARATTVPLRLPTHDPRVAAYSDSVIPV
jgi:PIN domain nuclease of toxin-antitoxin system